MLESYWCSRCHPASSPFKGLIATLGLSTNFGVFVPCTTMVCYGSVYNTDDEKTGSESVVDRDMPFNKGKDPSIGHRHTYFRSIVAFVRR